MAPVDLALEVSRPADAEPHAHARERIRARIRAVRVPRAADVGEGRELHLDPAFRRAPDREAQLERGREAVVADELVLAIAAHGLVAAERELLEREERPARDLEVGAEDRLDAPGVEAAHPLELAEPGDEVGVWDPAARALVADPRRVEGAAVVGRAEHVE